MGIPTISCGDNPHVSFDFCHTAQTRDEYAKLLRNCYSLAGTPAEMRKESCIFHYMHNLDIDREQLVLRDKILELRRQILVNDLMSSSEEVIEAAENFCRRPRAPSVLRFAL
jgi:hypothetical protein